MFTHFGLQRRPTFTYKRKQQVGCHRTTSNDLSLPTTLNTLLNQGATDQHDSPLATPDSTSDTQSRKSGEDEDEDEDQLLPHPSLDIFDFPAEQAAEVSLMVASSRSLPSITPKAASTQKKKPRKVLKRLPKKSDGIVENGLKQVQPLPTKNLSDQTQHNWIILPAPSSLPSYRLNTSRKRKLNLVSRLKGAQGQEQEPAFQGYASFDEDDEKEELTVAESSRISSHIEPPKEDDELPPPCSYKEQMERELESLMRTEFGPECEEDTAVEQSQRPRYVPENPMNVRVTYKRSSNKTGGESDYEMMKLENILSELHGLNADV
ncbi:hypothetical protein DFQ28_004598 [Apophysomyces sp. BC1034]|nr:hypothetical protein DFQ29_000900 [Apophysomyces sp. BC1021]KAG0188611.1 hypothetical protein DFQ28_004598 [Apophysomyces sp. BC1034]